MDFSRLTRKGGKEQYLVPYLISSTRLHLERGVALMEYLERNGWKPQQVQDFTPTPMTLASHMQWPASTR